ncbi:MAG: hypothetical protein ACFNXW_07590 [Rothia dentocariosa]|jgi:hypothetical protein|uniref:hypothetical protein n=1 Tax=Rothia dentocariosa TaxID=2047 RepID=UPI0006610E27|nr:hypothetical protein [Rothia dentocariosa]MBF1355990.1 hypothetical protein [Mogibacterium diversum]
MKKTFYIIGGTAVGLLVVGVILFILAGWGSLVEYHAFEWRGVGSAGGASPLVLATARLGHRYIVIGLILSIVAIVFNVFRGFWEARQARKSKREHLKQTMTSREENQDQIES